MSINRLMDKGAVVHIHNGRLPSYKKNTFGSVLMRQKNLTPIIQRDVNHKEKNKYHILIHVYGIWKDGTDEIICRTAMETHGEQAGGQERGRKKSIGCMERVTREHITICKIDSQREFAI